METIRPTKVGAGARWEPLLVTNQVFYGEVAMGNGNSHVMGMMRTTQGIFIGVVARGAGHFSSEVTAADVEKKLKLPKEDAGQMADFINVELGVPLTSEQGEYQFKYCRP